MKARYLNVIFLLLLYLLKLILSKIINASVAIKLDISNLISII